MVSGWWFPAGTKRGRARELVRGPSRVEEGELSLVVASLSSSAVVAMGDVEAVVRQMNFVYDIRYE